MEPNMKVIKFFSSLLSINCYKRFSIVSLLCISCFTILIILNLIGCQSANKVKTITGTYAAWKNPFELRMIEEQDSTFKGIVKWVKNDCWTYIEGEFIGTDSLVYRQLDNAFGFGIVINDQWPAKISGDSISGKWIHPTHDASGNPYRGKIVVNGPPLSNIEKDVWKIYKNEKSLKMENKKLQDQIFTIRRQMRELNTEKSPQLDSLKNLRGNYAIQLLKSAKPFYQNPKYNAEYTTLIQRELNIRLRENFMDTKLDSSQISEINTLIEENPEGSMIHFRLNQILNEQTLSKVNSREDYFLKRKEFLLGFIDKKMHPQEMISYLFDFTYDVYQQDPSYYKTLMEKVNLLQEKFSEKDMDGINMLVSVIGRINQASKLSVGTSAPDFSAKALNGQHVILSSFKGKVVCLDFWASWCGPCRASTPRLKKIQTQFADQIVMLGVALEDSADTKKYIEENEIGWLNISAPDDEDDRFRDLYGINGIPTMFLIDKEGKIAHRLHPLDEELEKKISDLL